MVYRTCSLCEASCGLQATVDDNRIVDGQPDKDDVFSRGFACRKGVEIGAVLADPDRVRTPLIRSASGDFHEATWEDALQSVARNVRKIRKQHGPDAVAVYMGNPMVHQHGMLLLRDAFVKAIGTRNSFSAGSQDTSPRFAVSHLMYGSSLAVPVPDIDRTAYFICMGANPAVSNGSLLTAPDMRRRLRAIQRRNGRVVVVDPRLSATARIADEHVPVRPGGDAALLLAMAALIVRRSGAPLSWLDQNATGWSQVDRRLGAFDVDAAARYSGVPGLTIARLAREFTDAPSSTVYTRTGVSNSRFGTLATYAADLVSILPGRLGTEGGAMFASPALDPTLISRLPGMDGLFKAAVGWALRP